MPKEFEHSAEDAEPGSIRPTTRDDTSSPIGHLYLVFDGDSLTFDDRRMMMKDDNG